MEERGGEAGRRWEDGAGREAQLERNVGGGSRRQYLDKVERIMRKAVRASGTDPSSLSLSAVF